jgi:hypothetical protein
MNEQKWKQLFASARNQPLPQAPENFEADVMRIIRREPIARMESIADRLALWFPRVALVASLTIVIFIAGDFLLGIFQLPGISEGLARLSNEWLLAGNGLAL